MCHDTYMPVWFGSAGPTESMVVAVVLELEL